MLKAQVFQLATKVPGNVTALDHCQKEYGAKIVFESKDTPAHPGWEGDLNKTQTRSRATLSVRVSGQAL